MPPKDRTLIHELTTHVLTEDGRQWIPRVYARARGTDFIGWLVFVGDDGTEFATDRETTQPNLKAVEYWAGGLEPIYLDGALQRALHPLPA